MGGWEGGGMGGGYRWEAGGGLYLPVGLFGVAMSPRTTGHIPRQAWRALRDALLRGDYQTHLPSSTLHELIVSVVTSHGQQKPALEKQTSQLGPAIQQRMGYADIESIQYKLC